MVECKPSPPDGGWGYVCICAGFFIYILFGLVIRAFGIIYLSLLERFHISALLASWVGATNLLVFGLTAFLSSAVFRRFSHRSVVMVGCFLCAVGFVATGYAPNVAFVYLGFGLLCGIGVSLASIGCMLVLDTYFLNKKSLAVSLASTGVSVAMLIVPPLSNYLQDRYGYQGTMLIFSGLCLQGMVCAALYRPLQYYQKQPKTNQHKPINSHRMFSKSDRATIHDENPSGAILTSIKPLCTIGTDNTNCKTCELNITPKSTDRTSIIPQHRDGKDTKDTVSKQVDNHFCASYNHGTGFLCLAQKGSLSVVVEAQSNPGLPQDLRSRVKDSETRGHHTRVKDELDITNEQIKTGTLSSKTTDTKWVGTGVRSNSINSGEVLTSKSYDNQALNLENDINDEVISEKVATKRGPSKLSKIANDLEIAENHASQPKQVSENGTNTRQIDENEGIRTETQRTGKGGYECVQGGIPTAEQRQGSDKKYSADADQMEEVTSTSQCSLCLSLLKDIPAFGSLMAVALATTMLDTSVYSYVPAMAIDQGLTPTAATLLISWAGITETLGRLCIGFILDQPRVKMYRLHICSLFFTVASVLGILFPLCANLTGYILCIVGYALAICVVLSQRLTMAADLTGPKRTPLAFGILNALNAAGVVIGRTTAGVIKDNTGQYDLQFYICGSVCAACALSFLMMLQCCTKNNRV